MRLICSGFLVGLVFVFGVVLSALAVDVNSLIKTADEHFKAAQYEEALLAYDAVIEADPACVGAWFRKGTILG